MTPDERDHLDCLKSLVEARSKRMQPNGRPKFDLTEEELESSSRAAMKLAGYDLAAMKLAALVPKKQGE